MNEIPQPSEILLLKIGELTLKGQNRRTFEEQLIKNLRQVLAPLGEWQFQLSQSTLQAVPLAPGIDMREAAARAARVFGLSGYSRAARAPKEMEAVKRVCASFLAQRLQSAATFKVEAKRSDKSFPLNSPQICEAVGEHLLEQFPHLRVDVHHPEVTV
ncbi:MAG: THUMP domain-containing protein, partial [Oscillospiraceae bacterium]|nr:THUMP domain-containing protein [Oscillospiraceae bacterium]